MNIKIFLGDITELNVDAIVNAANCTLLGGGGVDGAIHKKAGKELLEECKKFDGCSTGEAIITKGYNLPARYVIHTPGPIWRGGNSGEERLLELCYLNSLEIAFEYKLSSIAFPCISTGVYRFPLIKASEIAISSIRNWRKQYPDNVIFCVFSSKDKEIYKKKLGI